MKTKIARFIQMFIVLVFLLGSVNLQTVFAQDETPVVIDTPQEVVTEQIDVTEVPATEVVATSVATEIPTEVATEVPVVTEDLSEVVEILNEQKMQLTDASGEALPLGSQEAAEVLSSSDPFFWDPINNEWVGYATTSTGCPVGVTCNVSATPFQAAVNAAPSNSTIYVAGAAAVVSGTPNSDFYYNEDVIINKTGLSFVGFNTISSLGSGVVNISIQGYAIVKSITLNADFGSTSGVYANQVNLSDDKYVQDAINLLNATPISFGLTSGDCDSDQDFINGWCVNKKIDWCHCQQGNGCNTITIDRSAIKAHEDHIGDPQHPGEHAGPCESPSIPPCSIAGQVRLESGECVSMCQFNPEIASTDAACPAPCEFNPEIASTDAECVPPTIPVIPVTGAAPGAPTTPALLIPVTGGQLIPVTGGTLIVSGIGHSCMTYNNGQVICWGLNASGQVGDGTLLDQHKPVYVKDLEGVLNLTAGSKHTCALTIDGEIWCWGENSSGQLGNNTVVNSNVPVKVEGLPEKVLAITAGEEFTCAQMMSQDVWCWGNNKLGQLNDGTTINQTKPVKSKLNTMLAQISGGQGLLLGSDFFGSVNEWAKVQAAAVKEIAGSLSISANRWGDTGCAVASDGSVKCWGSNLISAPIKDTLPAMEVGAGMEHNCVVNNDQTVSCWGANLSGQLGNGSYVDSLSATLVRNMSKVRALGVGANHTCVLSGTNNTPMCWGENTFGQLGNDSTTNSNLPVYVILPAIQ